MCFDYSEQLLFAIELSFEQIDDTSTCPDRWQLCSFLDKCEYWSSGQWTPPTWQKIFSVPRCLSEGSESLVSAFSETSPQLRQLRTHYTGLAPPHVKKNVFLAALQFDLGSSVSAFSETHFLAVLQCKLGLPWIFAPVKLLMAVAWFSTLEHCGQIKMRNEEDLEKVRFDVRTVVAIQVLWQLVSCWIQNAIFFILICL